MSIMGILGGSVAHADTTYPLGNATISQGSETDGFAQLTFQTDGTIDKTEGVTPTQIGSWIVPNVQASGAYEVRATLSSGTAPTGTLNTWLPLSSARSWSLDSPGGFQTCNLLVELRKGTTVVASATYTLESDLFTLSLLGDTTAPAIGYNANSGNTVYRFNTNGTIDEQVGGGSFVNVGTFCNQASSVQNLQIMVTEVAGTINVGHSVDTWHDFSVARFWGTNAAAIPTVADCTFTVFLRWRTGSTLESNNYRTIAVRMNFSASGETVTSSATVNEDANAGIRFNNVGQVHNKIEAVYTQVDSATDWSHPSNSGTYFSASDYEVRATLNSGSTPTGTLGTWLNLGTTREWDLVRTTNGTGTCNLTIEVRHATTLAVLGSGTYVLNATKRTVTLSGETISASNTDATATAAVQIDNDGNVYRQLNGGALTQIDTVNDWLRLTSATPGDFEVRLTVNSGSSPTAGPTPGTWNVLSTDRKWELNRTTVGTNSGNWTIAIRDSATQTIRASATYIMSAEYVAGWTVTVSGEVISRTAAGSPLTAEVHVNTDGTIDKQEGVTVTQIDPTTDWIIPNGQASSLFEVHVTTPTLSGHAHAVTGDATNTWLAISVQRTWAVVEPHDKNWTQAVFTMSIRYNGGATLSSASYTLYSENT